MCVYLEPYHLFILLLPYILGLLTSNIIDYIGNKFFKWNK